MHYSRYLSVTLFLILLPMTAFCQSLQRADSLNRQGMEYYETGHYRSAERDLGDAYRMYKSLAGPEKWLVPGIAYAEILVDRAKYDRAIALFKKLREVARAQQNITARARIENDLGWAYSKMGKHDVALGYYKAAIPLAKQARDTLRLGYIYNNIGSIYHKRGAYKRSIEYRKKSLIYKRKAGDLKSISISLNNLGLSYRKLGLYDKALEYFNQSLSIKKQLGNVDLLGSAYNNIASLYDDIGEYDQALIYYKKSLDFLHKTGTPSNFVYTLNNIGTLYGMLGQPQQELAYYQQSLQIKEQYANPASLAVSYGNIAGSYMENGQTEKALTYFRKALSLRREVGNPRNIGSSLLDLARLARQQQNYVTARQYLYEAETIADSTQDLSLLQSVDTEWGALHFARGHYAEAAADYHRALIHSRGRPGNASLGPLQDLAITYHRLQSDSSLYYGQKAIDRIEQSRLQAGPLSQFKSGIFAQYADFYIRMASWMIKYENDYQRAFKLVESAKARALTDELSRAARRMDEILPQEVRLKRAQRLSELSDLYTSLHNTTDPEKREVLRTKIRNNQLIHASLENQLVQKYPRYKNLQSPEPISLERVQALCDDETVIMEYALGEEQLLIFFITSDDVQTHQINLTHVSPSLGEQVRAFRKAILAKAPRDSLQQLSRPLYNQLMLPFREGLQDYTNLLIIPDGPLAYLPFGAISNNNYLVSEFTIKYAPSMTGFSLLRDPDNTTVSLLAIGNAAAYTSRPDTPLLPSVDMELRKIAQKFDSARVLNGEEVTEKKAKYLLEKKFDFVHIAAHSIINERISSQSGIILGDPRFETGISNDGFLQSVEIYRLSIPSDMIVLSACKSGLGDMISGEGLMGMQRAFFNAGASTVVVSLWDVYDRSTTYLMDRFYTALMRRRENLNWSDIRDSFLRWVGWTESRPFGQKAAAMREAKQLMLNHPRYNHPVYWAPFVVIGR